MSPRYANRPCLQEMRIAKLHTLEIFPSLSNRCATLMRSQATATRPVKLRGSFGAFANSALAA